MPMSPSITLKDASYRYPTGTEIGPLSLKIRSGETIAIIGPTGHGKSTLLNILSGTVNVMTGELFIGNTPRNEIQEESFYEQMAFISQRTHMFAGTLRDNLTMGKDISEDVIYAALEQAQLSTWFHALPLGLQTPIGEGGRGLSGGEQQRIAIARAFVKKPSLLFFDEPTASLDIETEKLVTLAIEKLSKHATTIIVAHKYESIRHAEKIYVLENGCITACGTHETLQHPLYTAMKGVQHHVKANDLATEESRYLHDDSRDN